ncbi:MAG: helicase-exonuclease AddAB subunit AddA [Ruminococcus sp.]
MSRNWTENQRLAIEARRGSLLVSAAAGSGKTAVLVERVMRMVTDTENPVPIDRLLIVTYTRAAAAELKERISSTLTKLIAENPGNSWYRRQLVCLPYAGISTVDSFCSDLVREFFQRLSISGDYRIGESGELAILKQDALRETADRLYTEGDERFFDLVEAFSSYRDDTKLHNNILKLYEFLRSHPFADVWLAEKLSYYQDAQTATDSVWGKVILDYAKSATDYAIDITNRSIRLLEEEPELMSKVSALIEGDRNFFTNLKHLLEEGTWDEIADFVRSFENGIMRAKGFTDHPVKLKVAANRDIVKDTAKLLRQLFSQNEADCMADIRTQLPIVEKMFEAVMLFDRIYSELKAKKNIADFSDVEHWALQLLVERNESGEITATDVAELVSSRYSAVMVDEYQDANEVQDIIFGSVSNNGKNLFVVGDVKQSIYGFRQAMPDIFLGRKNALPLYSEEEDNYPSKVILERNFRSRKEVTDFVNFVFTALMSVEAGGLKYNDEEKLFAGASFPEAKSPCVEMHLLDLDEFEEETTAHVAEARHIASVILRMCKESFITENGSERHPQFGDFAILMRNMSSYADTYITELRRMGVPAVCDASAGFLGTGEITLAADFIRVVDNPVQDIPLTAVLMSPIYGFTPDDMAHIRAAKRRAPMYFALKEYADSGNVKAKRFISELDYLRSLAVTLPADSFINNLYDRTDLMPVATALFGKSAEGNLRLFSEYASDYEQGQSKGIGAFIRYIDRLIAEGSDLEAVHSTAQNSLNAVRLMTIHSSKGLEFPVCILANTALKFRTDSSENVLLHSKYGFASKRRDMNTSASYTTMPREAIAAEIQRSEKSEELRVLYVAMTRAKERLLMFSSKKHLRKYLADLSSVLISDSVVSPYVVRSAKSLSDWLVTCALLHPNADNLRDYAGVDRPESFICDNTGNFSVQIIDSEDYDIDSSEDSLTSEIIYEETSNGVEETVKARFEYQYPYEALTCLPQKVTASELAHKHSPKHFSRILKTPAFVKDTPALGTVRGTAMHRFLEKCDFASARRDIKSEINRLVETNNLTGSDAQLLDVEGLLRFVNSDIVTLALETGTYFREYRFTVNMPAAMADSTLPQEALSTSVILQGAVDLVVIDSDEAYVVDYKTDRVKSTDELLSMYSKQLELYKYAVEKVLDKKVKKCCIYSVHLSEIQEVLM